MPLIIAIVAGWLVGSLVLGLAFGRALHALEDDAEPEPLDVVSLGELADPAPVSPIDAGLAAVGAGGNEPRFPFEDDQPSGTAPPPRSPALWFAAHPHLRPPAARRGRPRPADAAG